MAFTEESLVRTPGFDQLSRAQKHRVHSNLFNLHLATGDWHRFFSQVFTESEITSQTFQKKFNLGAQAINSALAPFAPEASTYAAWSRANHKLITMVDSTQGDDPTTVATRHFWDSVQVNYPWQERGDLNAHVQKLAIRNRSVSSADQGRSFSHVLHIAALSFLWALNTERDFQGDNLYLAILGLYSLGAVEVYAGLSPELKNAMLVEFPVKGNRNLVHSVSAIVAPEQTVMNYESHFKGRCPNFFANYFPFPSKFDPLNQDSGGR